MVIHLTEIDIAPDTDWLYGNCTTTAQRLQAQASVYALVLRLCKEAPMCLSYEFWGAADARTDRGTLDGVGMYVFDRHYAPKPAFWALADLL